MGRTLGIIIGVAAGVVVGHLLRKAPWSLNLTAIALTVAVIATVFSVACAKLRVAPEDGIELDLQSPDSD